jgi:hypothetical protein
LSALALHFLNLGFSSLLTNNDDRSDECNWYFINVLVDTVFGTFICYGLLLLVAKLANKWKIIDLQSGMYFEMIEKKGKKVARMKLKKYFIQLGSWLLIVIVVFYCLFR